MVWMAKAMTIVVIDTETTGFGHVGRPPRDDAIVSVGIAWRNDSGKLQTWEFRCNPGQRYIDNADPQALAVNGLTKESLMTYERDLDVAEKLHYMLDYVGCDYLTSYNIAFDRPFLQKAPWSLPHSWSDCIMLTATPPGGRWPKLKVACEQRGISTDGPLHSAGWDARLAYLLMEALEMKHAQSS